jgi:hypothetical protein
VRRVCVSVKERRKKRVVSGEGREEIMRWFYLQTPQIAGLEMWSESVVTASGGWEGHEEKKRVHRPATGFKLDDRVTILIDEPLSQHGIAGTG